MQQQVPSPSAVAVHPPSLVLGPRGRELRFTQEGAKFRRRVYAPRHSSLVVSCGSSPLRYKTLAAFSLLFHSYLWPVSLTWELRYRGSKKGCPSTEPSCASCRPLPPPLTSSPGLPLSCPAAGCFSLRHLLEPAPDC